MVPGGVRGVVCRCLCIHAFDIRMTLNDSLCANVALHLHCCSKFRAVLCALIFQEFVTSSGLLLYDSVFDCRHFRHITLAMFSALLCSRPWSTYVFSGSWAFQYEPSTTCPSRTGRSLCWSILCRANVEQTGANQNLSLRVQ